MPEKDRWIEIAISTPPQLVDALSNFLTESGAKGVFQEEVLEEARNVTDEPAETEELKAYFAANPANEKKIAAIHKYIDSLSEIFPDLKKPSVKTQLISDADWGEQWKKYFKPIRLAENIVIKPTWERYTPLHREIIVDIDPGMAFGTGQHASTRMCLEAMEDILLKDRKVQKWRVLDVGTGTGILAIAAAKLGAESVRGLDTDPKAVEVARKNVLINGVEDRVRIVNADVRKATGTFDLVVANLTAETLLKLKNHLVSLTGPGRYLIASGIIEQNAKKVEESFARTLSIQRVLREKEWVCYVMKKGDDA
ncbi:MAG: 50S ribosomal protein L11 methyltransferase [Syntrophobacterales bacterium]|nr:50S ribosomal protein L11 methyltransferase [Syntrophobacterales bacterium]